MTACKKFKPMQHLHHSNPSGGCEGCVYFSQANCRQHGETPQVNPLI